MPFSSRIKVGGNFAYSDFGVFQQNQPKAATKEAAAFDHPKRTSGVRVADTECKVRPLEPGVEFDRCIHVCESPWFRRTGLVMVSLRWKIRSHRNASGGGWQQRMLDSEAIALLSS
jgi:hypothetical protein